MSVSQGNLAIGAFEFVTAKLVAAASKNPAAAKEMAAFYRPFYARNSSAVLMNSSGFSTWGEWPQPSITTSSEPGMISW